MANKQIPLSSPNLDMEIVDNLKECIETGWISTGGRFIAEFEQKIAKYVGTNDAVSTQSGTAGLHVALRILGVGAGDEVIVPTLTFVAAVNPIKYIGAEPVFMDCDETFCIDPIKLEKFLKEDCEIRTEQVTIASQRFVEGFSGERASLYNKKTNRRIAAIIPVHIFGRLCDMEQIMMLAEQYHVRVLEDATEALGSYYTEGKFAGKYAGTVGDMGVYSFNANKIITTGGGGMIVSNNQDYLDEARYLTITAKETTPEEALFFVHGEVGYNYRMLNLQAALGVSQIDKLEEFIQTKNENLKVYEEELQGVGGITVMGLPAGVRSNDWFYCLYIDDKQFGETRDELMHRLIDKGIQCRPVWKLIHSLEPYKEAENYNIEKAYDYAEHVLNVPCSSNLTAEDVRYICSVIKRVI